MSEGIPKPPKIEKLTSSVVDEIPTPEYWKENQEPPFSREYIGFQIRVARELANQTGMSVLEAAKAYTSLIHPYTWPDTDTYIDTSGLSDEELADAIFEKEREYYEKRPPTPYHENTRYGCFSENVHPDDGVVDIHFSNDDFDDGTGPLQKEKIERRLHELKDLFTAIKRDYPEIKQVRGNSWLYNLEAYKRLFPESYTAKFETKTRDSSIETGRAWGQFSDSNRELKEDVAETFLKNIKALEEVTPETVLASLPYKVLTATGPIEDFYKKYGIE
jgi:hypothetical protein